jgi:hypothetical protein
VQIPYLTQSPLQGEVAAGGEPVQQLHLALPVDLAAVVVDLRL